MAGILPAPTGGKFVGVVMSHFGTEEEGERAIRPIRELGSVLMDTVARIPYCAVQRQLDVSYPKGLRHYWKSAFLKSVTDDVIDLLIETVSTAPSPFNSIVLEAYGGAIARVANDATAFGHRDAMFNLLILAISDNHAIDTEQTAWGRDVWQKILPHSTGGAYVNYLSAGEDVHSAYHDARFQRLAAIKAQYDPANLFRFNQNIPPAKA
jgi:FAD/FMN-containing dehydrogenase